jgi:adenosylcobinamide amidohydrolase
MTETNPFDNGDWQKTIDLPTGCRVRVDETRSVVQLPFPKTRGDCNGNATPDVSTGDNNTNAARRRWKAISSAIWNGGLRSFDPESTKTSDDPNTSKTDRAALVHVFNYKVPSTYDGLNPEPKAMLRTAISNEFSAASEPSNSFDEGREDKDSTTIGIMTAASMRSLRTATRSAGGVVVDAIVTAGISNARAAGASADFFGILPPEATQQPEKEERPPPGTINTVVVINGASLTEEAMIEAYAITIEAKCGACADYSIACAKNTQKLAQGTGTDCAVLLCPSNDAAPVSYSGKHCLLAELIGQAVREATAEAIRSNLDYFHGGSLSKYHASRCLRFARGILKGARPCVPAKPMDPVPGAPPAVLGLGTFLVLFCYGLCVREFLPRPATILLAAFAWDRCLPEPPLSVHPVVLAGTTISLATNRWIPAVVFERQRPVLGFCAGLLFLVGTLSLFVMGAHGFLSALRWTETTVTAATFDSQSTNQYLFSQHSLVMVSWVLEVLLFKTTFSLQLLCTIALQMAGFLERSQMQEARAQLSWLCSRDPTHLNSEELAGGTLESLSVSLDARK